MRIESVRFEDLVGKTLVSVDRRKGYDGSDSAYDTPWDDYDLVFTTDDGVVYLMTHLQDCCERVYIESIVGDLEDLVGTPILLAECTTQRGGNPDAESTSTWTFYKLATIKGYVDIRWYGTSNGYYSEAVEFFRSCPTKDA